jgi:hypothetical protein
VDKIFDYSKFTKMYEHIVKKKFKRIWNGRKDKDKNENHIKVTECLPYLAHPRFYRGAIHCLWFILQFYELKKTYSNVDDCSP